MKISVKFCGNCSPRIEAWQVYRDVADALPGDSFAMWKDEPNPDVLLVLNSCRVACATIPEFAGPTVTASPEIVNRRSIDEDNMPEAICSALEEARVKQTM